MARKRSIRRLPKKQNTSFLAKLLPESAQAFVARRLVDGIALGFCLFGLFTLLALLSYTPADPSMNTAVPTDQNIEVTIQNWGGLSGAWIADLLAQSIGLAGGLLGGIFMIWGLRLFQRQSLSPFWAKSLALILGCASASIALAVVPSHGWLVTESMGSTFGELMYGALSSWSIMVSNAPDFYVITLPSAVLALVAIGYAAGITLQECIAAAQNTKSVLVFVTLSAFTLTRDMFHWVAHYNDEKFATDRPKRFDLSALVEHLKAQKPKRAAPAVSSRNSASTETPTPTPVQIEPAPQMEPQEEPSFAAQRIPRGANIPVVQAQKASEPKSAPQPAQSRFPLSEGEWEAPPISLLQDAPAEQQIETLSEDALRKNAELLQNVLADYNVEGEITSIHPGPVVTLYEFEPAPGVKSSKVISLSDDIARSMSAVSVRCAVVPGRSVIGIELPNKTRQTVYMQELLASRLFEKTSAKLALILGKDIGGQSILADLAKMPHLLVAGTTGSGKSVAVNTMILSLLYRLPPEKCRFIMIDPKMLELSIYDKIPHLLSPVVTEPGKAVVALKWTVQEMEERYRAMSKLGVRNIEGYNKRLEQARESGESIMQKVQTGFDPETGQATYEEQEMDLTELPYIVVVVDEFADLMLVAGKDVENAIQRLAQMARAAGIHLIMATQRPSVDVITGVIKANFPTRISFQVTSKVDSRTILGEGGAEQLLGMGDMLYMAPGGRITRVHGPFASDHDVEEVTNYLRSLGEPNYIESITDGEGVGDDSEVMAAMFGSGDTKSDSVDELYDQAVAIVAREGKASTSFIQRHLQIGYNRAARIIEEMERQGIISKASPTGKREILVRDFSDV